MGPVGCGANDGGGSSSPSGDSLTSGTVDQRRAAADALFLDKLARVEAVYENCKPGASAGASCTALQSSSLVAPMLRPKGILGDLRRGVCEVLAPYRDIVRLTNYPYLFYGMSATAGAGQNLTGQAGLDVVWDLWNRQLAQFYYFGNGISDLKGIEASVYAGAAFGQKDDVIDAWSGPFVSVALSKELPLLPDLLKVSGSLSGFTDETPGGRPGFTITGGAVGVTGTFALDLKFPGPDILPSVSVGRAVWTAFDIGTQRESESGMTLVNYEIKKGPDSHIYIQFGSASDMAIAMLWRMGEVVAPAAAAGIAMEVLTLTGAGIDLLCPAGSAGAHDAVGPTGGNTPPGPAQNDAGHGGPVPGASDAGTGVNPTSADVFLPAILIEGVNVPFHPVTVAGGFSTLTATNNKTYELPTAGATTAADLSRLDPNAAIVSLSLNYADVFGPGRYSCGALFQTGPVAGAPAAEAMYYDPNSSFRNADGSPVVFDTEVDGGTVNVTDWNPTLGGRIAGAFSCPIQGTQTLDTMGHTRTLVGSVSGSFDVALTQTWQ